MAVALVPACGTQVALRRVLKQMHSLPGAKTPQLALKLKDESQDDVKFIFASDEEKDQTKDMVHTHLLPSLAHSAHTRAHARTHAHAHTHTGVWLHHRAVQVAQCLVNPINTPEGAAAAAAAAAASRGKSDLVAVGGPANGNSGAPVDLLQTAEAAALKENPVLLELCKDTTKEGGVFDQAEFWQGYELDGSHGVGHASAAAEAAASRVR